MAVRHLRQGFRNSLRLFAIHFAQELQSQMYIPGRHDPHSAQPQVREPPHNLIQNRGRLA